MTDRKVTPFLFEGEITVRVIDRAGAPWFVAADVCRAVRIKQAGRAVSALDDDEKGMISIHTLGGEQTVLAVTEGGLYTLLIRSRQATTPGSLAHRFRRWVTGEVLPAMRRTGQVTDVRPFEPGQALPETIRLRMVREARQTFGMRAAGQLWFGLGLPIVPAMRTPPPQRDLFR